MKILFTLFSCCLVIHLFGQVFHGVIDDKYPIIIELEASNKLSINGSYQYKKIGKDLSLKGSFTADQDLTGARAFEWKEFDSSGRVTGVFRGTWTEDLTVNRIVLYGEWINPKTNKKLPFVAMEQKHIERNKPYVFPEIYSMNNEQLGHKAFFALPKFHKITQRAALKIESHLSFEKLLESSFKDIRLNYEKCACGHVGLNYKVHYLQDSIINLEIQSEFLGPYPSVHQQFFTFNIFSGQKIKIDHFINEKQYDNILAKINEELQKRKNKMEEGKEYLEKIIITKDALAAYSLSTDGIIFHITYPIPHYLAAFQPATDYLIPWSSLD